MSLRNGNSCAPQISDEERIDAMYNFLKEGAPNETLENNRMIEGAQPDAYPAPPTRALSAGTSEALWGQEPHEEGADSQTGNQHSNALWEGFRAGREKFLANNFDGFGPSQGQAVDEMGQLLDHFKDGDHESGTPFLRDHSKRNPAVVATVFDKTKDLLDR